MRTLVALAVAVGIVVASPASSTGEARTPRNVGPNTGAHAMLTYDDCFYAPWTGTDAQRGDHGLTPASALELYKATINEFAALRVAIVVVPTGRCVNQYKRRFGFDIAAYARARGHYVMSHTNNHRDLPDLGDAGIRWTVRNSTPSYWLRPPHGRIDARSLRVVSSMGKHVWKWTWSGADWKGYSQEKVVADTVANCSTGDTCLLHLHSNGFNPSAARQIVAGMAAAGAKHCGKNKPTGVRWQNLYCRNVNIAPADPGGNEGGLGGLG